MHPVISPIRDVDVVLTVDADAPWHLQISIAATSVTEFGLKLTDLAETLHPVIQAVHYPNGSLGVESNS